jgi:serine/threonine protein kinase
MIYSSASNWKQSYLQKYKSGSPLPEKTVASFARQILEAMVFLERKGWPYQVVSTGNVLLSRSQSRCHLCDVESSILDIPPRTASLVPRVP